MKRDAIAIAIAAAPVSPCNLRCSFFSVLARLYFGTFSVRAATRGVIKSHGARCFGASVLLQLCRP